ncbi:MAG: hypothetical protein KKF89_02175 [Nanoarchaeota archaeon]|nr:hypothetical protein [Nanoarchaeota archaeon]MBU1854501.1 hypothetical protein [Nanoarchaeota archaeon]
MELLKYSSGFLVFFLIAGLTMSLVDVDSNIGGLARYSRTSLPSKTSTPSVKVTNCPSNVDSLSEIQNVYGIILKDFQMNPSKSKYTLNDVRDFNTWYQSVRKTPTVINCNYKMPKAGYTINSFVNTKVLGKTTTAKTTTSSQTTTQTTETTQSAQTVDSSTKVISNPVRTVIDYVWMGGQLVARIKE